MKIHGLIVLVLAAEVLPPAPCGEEDCTDATMLVGTTMGLPGNAVQLSLLGKVSCGVTGFSAAIGYDPAVLTCYDVIASPFLVAQGGTDLEFGRFIHSDRVTVYALFDISPPITAGVIPIPQEVSLVSIFLAVSPGAVPGFSRVAFLPYSAGQTVATIFSGRPGQPPIEPLLRDGGVSLPAPGCITFIRGDANQDGRVNIADPIFLLAYLFQGGKKPLCGEAADANDDRRIDISDAVYLLSYLFAGGKPPPPPFPLPGPDPNPGTL